MAKPILFLDFDHTLFDTEQLRAWLGDDAESRIQGIVLGTIPPPNFIAMLYPDTLSFLKYAGKTHRLVLLTYTKIRPFQEKKIHGSRITPFFDDILITSDGEAGGLGKGLATREYLHKEGDADASLRHVFVDDLLENLADVKTLNPAIHVIQIERMPVLKSSTGAERVFTPDSKVYNLEELLNLLPTLPPSSVPMGYQ